VTECRRVSNPENSSIKYPHRGMGPNISFIVIEFNWHLSTIYTSTTSNSAKKYVA